MQIEAPAAVVEAIEDVLKAPAIKDDAVVLADASDLQGLSSWGDWRCRTAQIGKTQIAIPSRVQRSPTRDGIEKEMHFSYCELRLKRFPKTQYIRLYGCISRKSLVY
jgi:hypothetical protein